MIIYALLAQIRNPVITGFAGKTPDAAPNLLGSFISSLVGLLLVGATIFTLFQFLQGAMEWIMSGGDKGNIEKAQNHMTNAVLGLVITFAGWAFYILVLNFLGISPVGSGPNLQFKIPTLL